MTRQEAIDAAPVGRGVYWSSLVMWALFSVVFLAVAVFAARRSLLIASVAVLMVLLLLVMAAQGVERLFYPERAAERSASLSDTQRLWMRRLRTLLLVSYATLGVACVVLFVFGEMHKLFRDLQLLWLVPYILASILTDVMGERMGGLPLKREANILQGKLGALRSEHWGEQG